LQIVRVYNWVDKISRDVKFGFKYAFDEDLKIYWSVVKHTPYIIGYTIVAGKIQVEGVYHVREQRLD
jgi:hypothetical protein